MRYPLLKRIDSWVGTPVCFMLGVWHQIRKSRDRIPETMDRVLFIKLVAMGDMIVLLPMLRAFKLANPGTHVTILTTPRCKEIVDNHSFIDAVIIVDPTKEDRSPVRLWSLVQRLRADRYDVICELTHYYRFVSILSYLARPSWRIGFKLPGQGKKLLLDQRISYDTKLHEVEMYMRFLPALNTQVPEEISLVQLPYSDSDAEIVDDMLTSQDLNNGSFIICHPGTSPSVSQRQWPVDRWKLLVDGLVRLNAGRVVIIAGPDEPTLAHPDSSIVAVSTADLSLAQLGYFISGSRLYIGLDTGPTHLAAASGTPTLGLYGPNTPIKWGPYGNRHRTIYSAPSCSPCIQQYRGRVSGCQRPICMSMIGVTDVVELAREMLH